MQNLSLAKIMPRTFALSCVAIFALLFTVACGNDGDSTATGALDQTPTPAMTTPAATGTETMTGTPGTNATLPGGTSIGALGVIGACLEAHTDASMLDDLRDGQTASAESVYTTCLEDVLPPAVVADLEPVIEQAAACGSTAAADLTDDDIAAIENGDSATVEQVSRETLDCLSNELGIPLS